MEWVLWFANHWTELITAIVAVLTALIALFLIIPGDQPEKTIKIIADFLAKFSKK